jgi:hypothetical protein
MPILNLAPSSFTEQTRLVALSDMCNPWIWIEEARVEERFAGDKLSDAPRQCTSELMSAQVIRFPAQNAWGNGNGIGAEPLMPK